MKLEKIISLANKNTELRFRAMVRSLRDTGCNLPVWVIPYDDDKFILPDNCIWWEMDDVFALLQQNQLHNFKRKFQCFLTTNYQFVDADVIFLKSPEHTLTNLTGFVTSCGHWNNPEHTYIPSTLKLFKEKSTTWQKSIFNSGQFACDTALYNLKTLKQTIKNPAYVEALVTHDQISINLFVFLTGIKVTNLTLPPLEMESTWAGDYTEGEFEHYWKEESKRPYLIHWAGFKISVDKPIDKLFTKYLTKSEIKMLNEHLLAYNETFNNKPPGILSRIKKRIIKS